ncbi:MAG: hypothetical protein RBU30_24045, partial [Polyangia bacterium]|nr:hypothetical protein [Polyangia bacterium]
MLLFAPIPVARAQCGATVSSPDLQAALGRCVSWRELYYDPSLGLLPSELPDPWVPIYLGCSTVSLVGGKLRIDNDSMSEACLGAAGYLRSEPGLSAAPLYLMQMGVQIVSVNSPWLSPDGEPSLWFSSV